MKVILPYVHSNVSILITDCNGVTVKNASGGWRCFGAVKSADKSQFLGMLFRNSCFIIFIQYVTKKPHLAVF